MFRRRQTGDLCCPGLEALLAGAGTKGLAALVKITGSHFMLVLQARGIDFGDEHLVASNPSPRDGIWKISESRGMRFCPFCGERIDRVVARARDRFEDLAKSHQKYLDENPDRPALTGKPGVTVARRD